MWDFFLWNIFNAWLVVLLRNKINLFHDFFVLPLTSLNWHVLNMVSVFNKFPSVWHVRLTALGLEWSGFDCWFVNDQFILDSISTGNKWMRQFLGKFRSESLPIYGKPILCTLSTRWVVSSIWRVVTSTRWIIASIRWIIIISLGTLSTLIIWRLAVSVVIRIEVGVVLLIWRVSVFPCLQRQIGNKRRVVVIWLLSRYHLFLL